MQKHETPDSIRLGILLIEKNKPQYQITESRGNKTWKKQLYIVHIPNLEKML